MCTCIGKMLSYQVCKCMCDNRHFAQTSLKVKMETNRSGFYFNNGYQGEPSNQRIPSNKYIYQGQPLGQRNLSVQNSGERDPSEHRPPSRQNSSPAQLPSQSILSRQHNYQGQPFGQCNLSVQNSNQDERPYDCIPSRQNSEFDGASNLASGQQGTPTWYLGQSPNLPGPGQYLGSQVHYVPGKQVYIVPINGQAITQPGAQNMVRDTTTPMPVDYSGYQGEPSDQRISSRQNSDFGGIRQHMSNPQYFEQSPYSHGLSQHEGPQVSYVPGQQVFIVPNTHQAYPQPGGQNMVKDTITPMPNEVQRSIECIILSRVISALFILLDISLNWIQVASWNGSTGIPEWLNFLETINNLKGKSLAKAQCSQGSESLTSTYTMFCAIATAYGLARIVNMVGETIIEYHKQRPSENEPRFRGFQIIHGWVETALGLVCDDIPQAILLLFFSLWCQLDIFVLTKVAVWVIIKNYKNAFRVSSCKQHYKPSCDCKNCCVDCCMYSFNCVCCCIILYFRPCACTGDGTKKCCEIESYDMCPIATCCNGGRCCGEIENDPKWAMNLCQKLTLLFTLVYAAMCILTVLRYIIKF